VGVDPRAALSGPLRGPLVLVLAGLPGILSLGSVLPDVPGVPVAALLLQPALLLVVAAVAGRPLAARAGLRLMSAMPVVARAKQMATGLVLGLAIAAADHCLRGLWQAAPGSPPGIVEAWSAVGLVVGLLYGGVVEEVLFRWFAMSLLVVVLARAFAGAATRAQPWVVRGAVIGAALLFAASHLPSLALGGSPILAGTAVRALLLNGLAGLVFGLLFARRDLLAAMLAHCGVHLGFAAAALAVAAGR
jgi:hypothetical protein